MNLTMLLVAAALQTPAPAPSGPIAPIAPIAWYGTLDIGLAEARASARPILLMSAAPRCRDVPGRW